MVRIQVGYVSGISISLGITLALVVPASPAQSAAGVAQAVTTSATWLVSRGTAASDQPSLSADGQHLAFASSSALAAADDNGTRDVYLGRAPAGAPVPFGAAPTLVSVASNGSRGNGPSSSPSVSADGHYVAFVSDATNLVSGDTNGVADVFVRDLITGTTTRVQAGTQQPARDPACVASQTAASGQPHLSGDGHVIVFSSGAANLVAGDTNCARDVFRADLRTGAITRLNAEVPAFDPAISGDGRFASYTTGDATSSKIWRWSAAGTVAVGTNAASDHPGQTSLSADGVVAYVSSPVSYHGVSLPSGAKVLVESPGGHWEWVSDGLPSGTAVSAPAISADGSSVAFVAGSSTRLATTESRYGDDTALVGSDGVAAPVLGPAASTQPVLSATARTLALTTTTAVTGDTDTQPDVVALALTGGDQALHPALDTLAGYAKPSPLTYVDPKKIPATATDPSAGPDTAGRGVIGRGVIGRGVIGRGVIGRGVIGRGVIDAMPLSTVTLTTTGGWPELLLDTPYAGVPLDAITLGEICQWVQQTLADPNASAVHKQRAQAIYDLGLADLDGDSALGQLTIGSLLLLGEPVSKIAIPGAAGVTPLERWRDAVAAQGFDRTIVTDATLVIELEHAGVDLAAVGLGSVVASTVAPARTAFDFFGVSFLTMGTPLGQVAVAALPAGVRAAVVDCAAVNCGTATLEKAATAGAIRSTATLADLAPGLPDLITLDEVVRALLPDEFFPWEQVPWNSVRPGRFAIPKDTSAEGAGFREMLGYRAGFDTGPGGAAYVQDATLTIQLPPGAAYYDATFSATGPREFESPWTPSSTSAEDLGRSVRFHLGDVPSGTTVTVRVQATDAVDYDQADPLTAELRSTTGADTATIALVNPAGYAQLVDPTGGNSPTTAPRLTVPNRIYFGGITQSDDVDYVKIPRPAAGKRLVVALGSVGGDLDLGAFRASTPQDRNDTASGPGVLLEDRASSGHAQPAPYDIFDVAGHTLLDASAHTGTQEESVEVAGGGSGDVLLEIASGGKVSQLPYTLRYLVVDDPPAMHCPAYVPPKPGPFDRGFVPLSLPAGTNTVFLVDKERFSEQYGTLADAVTQLPVEAGQFVLNSLGLLTDTLGVKSVVIPITGYDLLGQHPTGGVRAARDAYNADPCSVSAANAYAESVKQLLNTYLATSDGSVKHVVIVGGDDQIPFHRERAATFDIHESWNAGYLRLPQPRTGTCADPCDRRGTPESAAAQADQILTDDPYGDFQPTTVLDRDLWVSDLAVARLVETPQDVQAAVRTFLDHGGVMPADSALATGYSAWADLPPAVADAVSNRVVSTKNKTLTGGWSRSDLEQALGFTGTGTTPQILSVNAHMSETGLLPADKGTDNTWRENDAYSTSNLPANADALLDGRVLFTVGCHAGGNLPDAFYGSATKDWAQVLGNVGGYVGNTGYGVADDSALALSERLMADYARWIGTTADGSPVTAGQALSRAKHSYLDGLGLQLGYDEKVLMQATYYGLPMWTFAAPARSGPAGTTMTWASGTSAGLTTRTTTVSPQFTTVTAPDGSSYVTVTGEAPQISEGFPLLAKLTTALPAVSGQSAHGALLTSLTSTRGAPTRVTVAAATSGGDVAPARYDDIGFPSELTHVSGNRLNLIADRVDAETTGSTTSGVIEKLTSVGLTTYYSSSTDRVRPILDTSSTESNGLVTFLTHASDASGIVRAVVLVQPTGSTAWQKVELSRQSDGSWKGTALLSGKYRAFAQVVDGAGNIGIDMSRGYLNKGSQAAPAFDAGPDATISQDGTLVRDLSISDSDSARFTGSYDAGDGTQQLPITQGPDGTWRAHLEIVGTAPGTVPVTVEICDDSGLCTAHTFQVVVRAANTAPEATVTLDTTHPDTNHVLVATATGSDADGDPVTLRYQWWVNDQKVDGATGTTFDLGVAGHGDYGDTVSVTVTPNDGKVDGGQSSASAIVRPNQPPTPDAGPVGTAAEGSAYTGTGTYTDPDDDAVVSGTVDYGDGSPVQPLTLSAGTFALNHVYAENGTYTVTVRVTDDGGATGTDTTSVTVTNVAPVIGPNLNPAAPAPAGTATTITATFTDAGALDTHTATVDWGDGTTSAATVDQTARTLTASHTYALTGTYTIGLTVTDDDGGVETVSPYDYGVVFDASGAYVSASGFFTSPKGAWPAQPTSNAKAEFGLSAKPGATALQPPTGKFRFTYDINPLDHGCMAATCLELDSTAYTSLTIVNNKATVKGAGTLNGKTGYKFVVVVLDASPDRVRVKITDALGRVVYDSQPGAAETVDPTTPLTGGSVLVKK